MSQETTINAQVEELRRKLAAHKEAQPTAATERANGAGGGTDEDIEELEIDPSEVQVAWEPVRSPVEVMSIEDYVKGDSKSYKLVYCCFAGPNKGRYRPDWAPKKGGGLAKTFRIAEALGLRDPETGKVKFSNRAEVVSKQMWINIVMVPEKREMADGSFEITSRDQIEFPRGYDHIDAFELPDPRDVFAEGEPVRRGS